MKISKCTPSFSGQCSQTVLFLFSFPDLLSTDAIDEEAPPPYRHDPPSDATRSRLPAGTPSRWHAEASVAPFPESEAVAAPFRGTQASVAPCPEIDALVAPISSNIPRIQRSGDQLVALTSSANTTPREAACSSDVVLVSEASTTPGDSARSPDVTLVCLDNEVDGHRCSSELVLGPDDVEIIGTIEDVNDIGVASVRAAPDSDSVRAALYSDSVRAVPDSHSDVPSLPSASSSPSANAVTETGGEARAQRRKITRNLFDNAQGAIFRLMAADPFLRFSQKAL